MNGLDINNPIENKHHPMAVEDLENPNCIIKSIYFYQTTSIYFKPKSPVGANTIGKWVREFAQVAGFKDWEKYTPHDNRHWCCTILASNLNVPEKVQMDHLRHNHAKSAESYIHQNSNTQKQVQPTIDNNNNDNGNNKNSNNSINKPQFTPSTKQVVIDVDQQDKENIPVPQDPAPAVVLGTKEAPPSKDTLKKEELKKENKKQRTKLQDPEEAVDQLTMDLKESNNINKTLTNEVGRLHWNGMNLQKEKTNLEQQLEKQKDLHEKELLQQQTELHDQYAVAYAKDLEDAKKTATKEAADEFKLCKMEWRNEKGRMETNHKFQVALAENNIKNEQQLRDMELKGKQNKIDQLHRQMNRNQCAIM
eukprot:jgi/Psemu1/9528/gm1.9528_g